MGKFLFYISTSHIASVCDTFCVVMSAEITVSQKLANYRTQYCVPELYEPRNPEDEEQMLHWIEDSADPMRVNVLHTELMATRVQHYNALSAKKRFMTQNEKLKTENEQLKLKVENEKLAAENEQLKFQLENGKLKAEIEKLKAENEKLKADRI